MPKFDWPDLLRFLEGKITDYKYESDEPSSILATALEGAHKVIKGCKDLEKLLENPACRGMSVCVACHAEFKAPHPNIITCSTHCENWFRNCPPNLNREELEQAQRELAKLDTQRARL